MAIRRKTAICQNVKVIQALIVDSASIVQVQHMTGIGDLHLVGGRPCMKRYGPVCGIELYGHG
jgi:hypothetical protein